MKKFLLCCLTLISINVHAKTNTVDLIQVFQEALISDPVWLEASAQNLSNQQGVPISLAALLPALSLSTIAPTYSRTLTSGPNALSSSGSTRGYSVALDLSQTLFDFGKFADLSANKALSKESGARLNAAAEDLIIRVSRAYFQILSDKDNLAYLLATRTAYEKQLEQTRQQYHVGLKTITDVYTAEASYESAAADYIGAENTLSNDRENLRAITGHLYPSLAQLRSDFPLVTPNPSNIDQWVEKAGQQNWRIQAAQHAAFAQKKIIQKQFAGHLPTFNLEGSWTNQFSRTTQDSFGFIGSSRIQTTTGSLNMALPLVEGGAVVAATRKAQYDYQVAIQQLEHALRTTLTQTRQSYLSIVSGISKIKADHRAIISSKSSLKGMRAGYHVGTETLVNVLNQQKNVFLAETQYTNDRFAYVNNLLALKQAAGTLGIEDLQSINRWLHGASQEKIKESRKH